MAKQPFINKHNFRDSFKTHFVFYLLLLTAFIISIVVIEMIAKGYINNQSRYVASSLKEVQLRFGIDEKNYYV